MGRTVHEGPEAPNEGRAGRGPVLRHGMVPAVEPVLTGGGRDAYRAAPDGWTPRTSDGSRASHAEHTVAVTDTVRAC